jgi:hypothetical protein
MHAVASLIGPGTWRTTDGNEYEIHKEGTKCEHDRIWCWNTDQHHVDAALIEELKKQHACGHNTDEYVEMPYGLDGSTVTVWCLDKDCDEHKTVHQKLIDLLWKYHEDYQIGNDFGGPYVEEHVAEFWHIVNFDLCKWEEIEHPGEYKDYPPEYETTENPEYQKWLEEEPVMEDIPSTIDEPVYEYSDKDKAQWYVNLWHRMNGPSAEKDGVETVSETTSYTEVTSNGTKTTTNTEKITRNRWDILEDGLMNSQDWLKYALETGTVSIERVNFTNPTEEGSGLKFGTWTSIQYNNALDISEQTDEAAIAKAEAEYQQKTREIENKDKQIDSMIKLLDTEHSALQTEYESVKSVITKNTERTLKIYSA